MSPTEDCMSQTNRETDRNDFRNVRNKLKTKSKNTK